MSKEKRPIIIKKIKKAGHAAHGGAWKVAYADFVTAMMAFFLLLWLLSSVPTKNLSGVADYFTPTIGIRDLKGMGYDPGNSPEETNSKKFNNGNPAILFGAATSGSVVKLPETAQDNQEQNDAKNFSSIEKDLYKAIYDNPDFREFKQNIKMDNTTEGLRIQILDQERKPMFIIGTDILQPYTKKLLSALAKYIQYMPNYLSITGHTSTDQNSSIDNWELSAKRANAARKFLIDGRISQEQIAKIIGKADQEPFDLNNLESVRNVRISLILLKNSLVPFQKKSIPPDVEK